MKMDTLLGPKTVPVFVKNRGLSKIADLVVPVQFCWLGSYCCSENKVFDFFRSDAR